MEIIEAVSTRKSIRAYTQEVVPKHILEDIIRTSIYAPSSSNTQPWSFVIIYGKPMDELKQALVQRARSNTAAVADFELPTPSGIYRDRRSTFMGQMYDSMGISREDEKKRNQWWEKMIRFFDAPAGIIVCLERSLTPWALVDAGIIIQNITLVAHSYGLGTCIMYRVVVYPDILKDLCNIPETKVIVCGISIGYPDTSSPVNQFRTERDSADKFISWITG